MLEATLILTINYRVYNLKIIVNQLGAMSGAAGSVKVLLAGDVCGKIETLFKRVTTVNASNGPFDALLCVGLFLPEGLQI